MGLLGVVILNVKLISFREKMRSCSLNPFRNDYLVIREEGSRNHQNVC